MPKEQKEQSEDNLTQAQRRDLSRNIFNFANLLIIAIAIGLLVFLVRIRGILGIFLAATVLSVLLTPPVQFIERRRIPRVAAILLVYLVIFGILIASVTLLVPVAKQQVLEIVDSYPEYRAKLIDFWDEFQRSSMFLG